MLIFFPILSKIRLSKHSWAKFKIILVWKPGRKFYYIMTNFQGSGFSFQSLNQNIKVVVFPANCWFQKFKVVFFPSNFWNITLIWRYIRVILNFAQECYYLENKVGIVVIQKPTDWRALGCLQNLLLPLYFRGNVSLLLLWVGR